MSLITRDEAMARIQHAADRQRELIANLRTLEAENLRDLGRWKALEAYTVTEVPLTLLVDRPLAYSRLARETDYSVMMFNDRIGR